MRGIPWLFSQCFPTGSGELEYRASVLTVSSPAAMMMAKFTIRLQLQPVCVSETSRTAQPDGVHLPPSTSVLQETQMGLSNFRFGWKFKGFGYLRIPLFRNPFRIQLDQPQEDVGMFCREGRKMLIFQCAVMKRNVLGARPVSTTNLVMANVNIRVNVPASTWLNLT